jgi:RNA polymerase sigma factor (sigma-70 family)
VALSELRTSHLGPLLARLRQNDRAAADELIRRAGVRLEAMARRQLQNYPAVRAREQTDDVVQEAAASLLAALRQVDPTSTEEFYGLAARQIRLRLLDLARKHRRSGPAVSLEALPGGSVEVPDLADRDLERWQNLHEAVGRLPAEMCAVFDLRFYQGWKWDDVADALGVSVRTARTRWLAAQTLLAEQLGDELPDA